jgi:hypothetical protein
MFLSQYMTITIVFLQTPKSLGLSFYDVDNSDNQLQIETPKALGVSYYDIDNSDNR